MMAPNVRSVGVPGRRTVYSLCGMCAVLCPIEVTVEDGWVVRLQGNSHDKALGAPNYLDHDASCAGYLHNAALSILSFAHTGLVYDLKNTKHLVLYGRNIIESLMVKEAKAFMSAVAKLLVFERRERHVKTKSDCEFVL